MFDNIETICTKCGKKAISQTKISGCNGLLYEIGEEFKYLEDCVLELKDPCNCGEKLLVVLFRGILYAPKENDKPTIRELSWGQTERCV